MPQWRTPNKINGGPRLTKEMTIDKTVKRTTRFSARNHESPGIARFCNSITTAASLMGPLKEELLNRSSASQGAVRMIATAVGIEMIDNKATTVERTLRRSRRVS